MSASPACQVNDVSFIKALYRQFSKLPVFYGRINTVLQSADGKVLFCNKVYR